MKRRWLLTCILVALLAAGVATALAATGVVAPGRGVPAIFFGPQMARAEVVVVVGGTVHDYRVDQGRIRGLRPGMLELMERDGTRQLVPLTPDVRVTLNGAPAALAVLRRGMAVLAIRDGDSPASILRAETLPLVRR